MTIQIEALIDELSRIEHKAEIVNGEILLMSPTGGLPGYAAFEIAVSLREYAKRTGYGHAISDNVGFLVHLPHRTSFSPDAAFYSGPISMKFIEGAPLFAAEVRSEGDYGDAAEAALDAKRADYFAAGTLVVWDVDLLDHDVVRVYRATAPATPTCDRRGEDAEAEPAVPGWRMPVDVLFLP